MIPPITPEDLHAMPLPARIERMDQIIETTYKERYGVAATPAGFTLNLVSEIAAAERVQALQEEPQNTWPISFSII